MDDFEREIKIDFLNEASDLVVQSEGYFIKLESEPFNGVLIDSIFRYAHNLKGTARAVGFGQIAELTHVAENLLLKIKSNELKVNGSVVDVLLRFNDQITLMISTLKDNLSASFEIHQLVEDLSHVVSGGAHSPSEVAGPKIPDVVSIAQELAADSEIDVNVFQAPSPDLFIQEEQEGSEQEVEIKNVVAISASQPKAHTLPEQTPAGPKSDPKKDDETIRVSLSRLSQLGDLVGELVILQSVVESALANQPSEFKTRRALSKLCKDIQEMSMSLRMVPVGGAFQKLQRIVRDTSKTLNKKVDLKLLGEDTEIDRTVLEQLSDPLVHLIRNSVDHGVEAPHDRLLAGKEESGTVEVMAFHEGSHLVIQITDDGHGMDPEKLRKKAIEKGIIPANNTLSEQECLNLIFAAGFSTKDQVSEVSGRGVGMDVVKTNIEALGGEIKLQSKKGLGSSIRLQLPLTMAIIDGMLVSSAGQCVVLPRGQIYEINRLEASAIHVAGGVSPFYKLRNEVLPLFSLGQDLGKANLGQESIALIVRGAGKVFAVAVEDVIRQQQVVVKPPTKEMANQPGIMGTTILGDGRPALILDLNDLYGKRGQNKSVRKAG